MFQMSEKIAFLWKNNQTPKNLIYPWWILSFLGKNWPTQGNIDLPLKNWVFFWKIWSTGPKDTWRGMECISLKDASATSWSMIVHKKKKRSNHWSRKEKLPCSSTQQIHFFAPGDSNFPRGKFYASTDWLSLYPPLSRFKPVQAILTGMLALYRAQAICFRYIHSSKVKMYCTKWGMG